jgi:hypothetical protein
MLSATVGALAIATFVSFPGANPRLRASVVDRLTGLVATPSFYVGFPAVGLGLDSIPRAIAWALPSSALVLVIGAWAGAAVWARLAAVTRPMTRKGWRRGVLAVAFLIVLTNVVVVLAVPQQGSPRVFSPTWLILSLAVAAGAASRRWPGARLAGAAAGLFAAGALLSLAFSATVRVRNGAFTQRAARVVAARVPEGGAAAICGVRRSVERDAPRGAFAVHEFIYEWSAERAVQYYTGRRVSVYLSGELWGRPCPPSPRIDAIIGFDELHSGDPR